MIVPEAAASAESSAATNSIFRGVSSFFHSRTDPWTARRVALPAEPSAFFVVAPPWREIAASFEPARFAVFETSESIPRSAFACRDASPEGTLRFTADFGAGFLPAAARGPDLRAGADECVSRSVMSSSLTDRVYPGFLYIASIASPYFSAITRRLILSVGVSSPVSSENSFGRSVKFRIWFSCGWSAFKMSIAF